MKFEFLIAVDIKNDELSRDATPEDLETILAERLLVNDANKLSWVLAQDIKVITRDTRRY